MTWLGADASLVINSELESVVSTPEAVEPELIDKSVAGFFCFVLFCFVFANLCKKRGGRRKEGSREEAQVGGCEE